MGTVYVEINDNPFFDWKGDKTAVQEILENFPRKAEGAGLTPDALADIAIRWQALGLIPPPPEELFTQEMVEMAVMWRIFTAESRGLPGLIGDHIPDGTFAACIDTIDSSSYSLEIAADLDKISHRKTAAPTGCPPEQARPTCVIQAVACANGMLCNGQYLESFDPDAYGGRGYATWTPDLSKATLRRRGRSPQNVYAPIRRAAAAARR